MTLPTFDIIRFLSLQNQDQNPNSNESLTVRFVRYPESQQLVIWLPSSGYLGYSHYLLSHYENELEKGEVSNKLNGSVQMLWDSLLWKEGLYTLQIHHQQGWYHELRFIKQRMKESMFDMYDSGVINHKNFPLYLSQWNLPIKSLVVNRKPENSTAHSGDSGDSGGSIEEATIRQSATQSIGNLFLSLLNPTEEYPRLEYEEKDKEVWIYYVDEKYRIPLRASFEEMDAELCIWIPTEETWEDATGLPVSKRRETLLFIAQQVRRDQAPIWRFEIGEDSIRFFRDRLVHRS